eukprot:7223-Heterococcus_DN1.PRE.3
MLDHSANNNQQQQTTASSRRHRTRCMCTVNAEHDVAVKQAPAGCSYEVHDRTDTSTKRVMYGKHQPGLVRRYRSGSIIYFYTSNCKQASAIVLGVCAPSMLTTDNSCTRSAGRMLMRRT